MKFVEAEVVSEPAGLFLQASGFKLIIPGEKAAKIQGYGEKHLIFGVRPEDLPKALSSVAFETSDEGTMREAKKRKPAVIRILTDLSVLCGTGISCLKK